MKKVIQICGSVRGGTTILGLILGNAPNTLVLGEVINLFYPVRQDYTEKRAELMKDPVWKKILTDRPKNLYTNLFSAFPEVELIIDSSKDPFWYDLDWNLKGYEIHRVMIYKSPKDLVKSFRKRGMDNWEKVYQGIYQRYFTLFKQTPSVSLDELLDEGSTCLKELCEFFGLTFSETRRNYWEREHWNFFGSTTVSKNKIEKKQEEVVKEEEQLAIEKLTLDIFDMLKKMDFRNSDFTDYPELKRLTYTPGKFWVYKMKDFVLRKRIYSRLGIKLNH